jgi:hypothetical protein
MIRNQEVHHDNKIRNQEVHHDNKIRNREKIFSLRVITRLCKLLNESLLTIVGVLAGLLE